MRGEGVRHPAALAAMLNMIAAFVLGPAFSAKADENARMQAQIAMGASIAQANCAACHAVGETGDGVNPAAPPFRTLSTRYPLDALEEALAEGIAVGHHEMPEFSFEPDEIDALLAYLQQLQNTGPAR